MHARAGEGGLGVGVGVEVAHLVPYSPAITFSSSSISHTSGSSMKQRVPSFFVQYLRAGHVNLDDGCGHGSGGSFL